MTLSAYSNCMIAFANAKNCAEVNACGAPLVSSQLNSAPPLGSPSPPDIAATIPLIFVHDAESTGYVALREGADADAISIPVFSIAWACCCSVGGTTGGVFGQMVEPFSMIHAVVVLTFH